MFSSPKSDASGRLSLGSGGEASGYHGEVGDDGDVSKVEPRANLRPILARRGHLGNGSG